MAATVQPLLFYIDDNSDDLRRLQKGAEELRVRFRLRIASESSDAVDYLSARGKYTDRKKFPMPEMVLLENALGNFKGSELLRWIRSQPRLTALPVVVFSRATEIHRMAECYAAGADYYLAKPGNAEGWLSIVRCLDDCLNQQPPRFGALREVSTRPELARQALKTELRAGIDENRKLRDEHRVQSGRLDATMAEGKERRKQVPFVPGAPQKPKKE